MISVEITLRKMGPFLPAMKPPLLSVSCFPSREAHFETLEVEGKNPLLISV
jgi:hypothetical protein